MPTTMDLGTYRGNAEVACCSFLYSLWDASGYITWLFRIDGVPVTYSDTAEIFVSEESIKFDAKYADGFASSSEQSIIGARGTGFDAGYPFEEDKGKSEDEHKIQLGITKIAHYILDAPSELPPELGEEVPPPEPWPGSNGTDAEKAMILDRLKTYKLTMTMNKTVKAKAKKDGKEYSCTIRPVWTMKMAVKDGVTCPTITDKSYKVVPEPEAAE
jgi:hypothetical protein